ncbi:elongin-A [Cryptococcus gattii E566]|uniref:Pof4 protein, putative n=2 Tax=Cryptococcus gattii TaxID=37769 RepID=E6REP4_CRYGW|nr:Pof4 protein, putative [Cryptococcus gattii WM276]ADV25171.1 Pof4 protein, putative [Cryptococcus gattii WM276]KIR76705.1 elongin-A [Cryptococcus gattii EJB2]KIY31636.1 elongin-A [Cryptococcus gattii E566]
MPDRLEYAEEEDLFGSEGEYDPTDPTTLENVNLSVPIATPTAFLPLALTIKSAKQPAREQVYPHIIRSSVSGRNDGEVRLQELRDSKKKGKEEPPKIGVRSLKSITMSVVQANSGRIWDIGDLEYSLVKPFIDEVPMEQLAEIEANSPHIKKDTDWLYEIFLLQDYRLFHERCRERQGQHRTTGWRKMYKKAKEDAAERQLQAADRVAARYKQLEEEKKSKSIIVLDRVIPDKKRTRGRGRSGSSIGSSSSSRTAGATTAIAKARAEVQRARIALTHASGRHVPPTRTQTHVQRVASSQLFKNPFLPNGSASTSSTGYPPAPPPPQSRLPPPKSLRNSLDRITSISKNRKQLQHSLSSPISGSFPTSQYSQVRAALPTHLSGRTGTRSFQPSPERFRIDDSGKKKEFKEIHKPQVKNFEAPKLEKEKSKQKVDFFGHGGADGGGIFRIKKRKLGTEAGAGGAKRPTQ